MRLKIYRFHRVLALVLTIVALMVGQQAMAENSWEVTFEGMTDNAATFKVKRTGDTSIAETVNYRTVSLSAYAGKHFTATYGQLNFGAGDDYKTVSVTELSPNDVFQYHKAGIANLSYRLEVTDVGGFHLAHDDRSKSWGSTINSSNAFAVKDVTVNSGEITVKDENYSQAYHAVNVSSYFSAAAPKAYLTSAGAELRMTLSLQAKEKDDGYQHLQILVNQTSNHDEGAGDNNPGTMSYSSYMATFCHQGGSTNTTYANYSFPVASLENWTYKSNNKQYAWTGLDNSVGDLRNQQFNTNCRADDGRLVISTKANLSSFSTLGIRFDASGDNEDTWYANNTVAHIQAVDVTAPTVSQVTVCPGIHAKGNPIYVSIAFNEIVTISGSTKKLTTNWGNLNYIAGDGTNVLTFGGDISSSASGQLRITGKNGTISDLAGKTCSSVNQTIGTSLDASHTYTIAYDLAGGTLETANPTTYNYETPTFTLANPTRTGYTFTGWTGSNGNTPQTTVTIAQGSHGDKSYTAQWTNPSGTCGNSATWLYDHSTHTLTIGGSGEIDHCAVNYAPWQDYKPYITNLSIGDGITVIGMNAFRDCAALTTITGGGGIIYADPAAFINTPWYGAALASTDVVYLGQTAFCGMGVSGAVSIQDGTIRICGNAFQHNQNITTVTIPATVTHIEFAAFDGCSSLTTVNVLAATPPALASVAFAYTNHALARTYNVRNASYKTDDGWADIYNKEGVYAGNIYSNCTMRVISTLTLPDDVTATADAADIVTDGGTDYYAEGTTVTVAFPATVLVGGVTYANSVLLNGSADGVTTNGSGSATFTMPDADATVSLQRTPVSVAYIDENGQEQICTDFVLLESKIDDYTLLGANGQTHWYVASGDVTIGGQLCFKNSHSHLILCDGATLTATCSNDYAIYGQNGGITIYGQTEGSGTLSANATGTGGYITGIQASGDFTINGGHVSASGGGRHGIYCGGGFTINGGSVSATSNATSSGSNGIYSGGNIVLGWSNISDRITASSYGLGNGGTVSVKDGQTLYDGAASYTGTLTADQIAGLAEKSLQPAIPYIDEDGQEQVCTDFVLLESNDGFTEFGADGETHWYVASGNVTFGEQLQFRNSQSHLILCDGATLTATSRNYAIYGQNGGITIYGQTEDSGTLSASSANNTALMAYGAITINGGHVSASGRTGIFCIYNITINGGSVSATGGGGEGIYCAWDFTINGGSVSATSNNRNGIYSDGNIVLGWSNISDRITASSYGLGNGGGTVSVKAGLAFHYGAASYTGTLTADQIADLAGQTLEPAIPYIDENGEEQICTDFVLLESKIDDYTLLGKDGEIHWYVASGNVTFGEQLCFRNSHSHLILCDGATLTATCRNDAIYGQHGDITIYGQSEGSGTLSASSANNTALMAYGNITINGGHVSASGRSGIECNNKFTINGGSVSATGGGGEGIFCGEDFTFNGGSVNATSSNYNGIYSDGNIVLGWSNISDRITASSYGLGYGGGTVSVKAGRPLRYGTTPLIGDITASIDDLAGQTLEPAVPYIDENGQEQICTDFVLLESSNLNYTNLGADGQSNWYVASGDVTFGGQLCFRNSHSHLILCDGATLTATSSNDAIYGQHGGITIYGQTEGSGTIRASSTTNTALMAIGNITINGGHVSATGRFGINCNYNITINGGSVSATGGIEKGIFCGGDFTFNGGSVNATSNNRNGIYSDGNIVLGWSNISDRITASSYGIGEGGTVSVKAGLAFYDGAASYTGTLTADQIAGLDEKSLQPAIPYIDEDGQEQVCTDFVLLESNDGFTEFGADGETHWYVASGDVTFGGQLQFRNSQSHLILCDGATLTATSNFEAIYGQNGDITIYGQTEGSGTIRASSTNYTALMAYGNITINGGHVSASGRTGISCSNKFTINGGSVSATGGSGRGISCGWDFTINGGSVSATSNNSNGIYSEGNIVLGWSNISDRITASSYGLGNGGGTVSVKAGRPLRYGTTPLIGDITASIANLAGQTLEPAIPYIDENGQEQICTDFVLLESSNLNYTNLGADNETHWYVASGNVTFGGQICFINSHSHLILCDGATLTATCSNDCAIYGKNGGITIYGQTEGSGALSANGGSGEIGIHAIRATINGGHVSASGHTGISCSYFTINGGSVSATGSIGRGISCGRDFTFNGGSVNATSSNSNGIYSDGNIVLGWSNISDRITASSYGLGNGGGTVSVKADQTLYDGTTALTSDITASIAGLAGKTLEPGIPFDIDGTVILLDDDRMQPDGYKNADRIAAFHYESHNVMLYGRTLYKDGSWNTLCLPFSLTLSGSVLDGDNVDVRTLSSSSFSNGTLTLNFTPATGDGAVTELQAGTPYIIKWSKSNESDPDLTNLVNPVFTGVTVSNAMHDAETSNVTFKGTYSPVAFTANDKSILFLGGGNKLYYPASDMTMGAFRAYFQLNGITAGDGPSSIKEFRLNFGEDDTTGVIEVNEVIASLEVNDDSWYDMQGRKLDGKPSKGGIYIHNGRKVLK